jgi:hypothetical protein
LEGAWAGPKAAASVLAKAWVGGAVSSSSSSANVLLAAGATAWRFGDSAGWPAVALDALLAARATAWWRGGCTHTHRLAAVVGGAAVCTHTRRLAVVVGGAAGFTRTRRLAAAVGGDAGCTHTRRLAAVVSDEARCEQRRGHRTAAHHACRRGAPEVAHGLALGPHVRYALGPLHLPPEPRHVGDGVDACGTQRWCGSRVLQPRGSR